MKKLCIKILYKLISLLDHIDYHFIRHKQLIDNYKTIEEIKLNNIEILTDTGYQELSHIMTTKPFEIYTIKLENGYELDCADEHKVFDEEFNELFVKDLSIGQYIQTDKGLQKIISLTKSSTKISMCDTTVNDENHRFYSNGILSHNSTTTAIYGLWVILFNTDKTGLILSKSGPAGVDLLSKIKDMYLYLPYYLKCGTMKWNQTSISFDNNSSISTESFSPTAGLGKTINFLILDEFAWCPSNEVELFYNNIIPTVTTITDSNVCIMSTQNGFNLFCKIWQNAITKKSIYAPYKVDWWQVPNWNPQTKQWEKRTEAWRQMMIGILGSEEDFEYQYGTKFSASDKCLVSRETLTRVHDRVNMFVNKDLDISLVHKNNLLWKEDFDLALLKTGYFIITIDLSEGGGSDSTVFTIFHVIDDNHMEQVGVYRSNKIDIEMAALELWLLLPQLFAPEHYIFSIEWNTYGALFYQLLLNLNEIDYREDWNWRFNIHMELDMTAIVRYKKGSDDAVDNNSFNINQTIPGIRWNSSNKIKACALLRMEIEKNYVTIYDLETATELENFEDKNGNGSYKASYGHDDNIMTFCQIPLLKKTPKFKNLIEDINDNTMSQQILGGFTSFYQY